MSQAGGLPFTAEYAKSNRSSCKGCKDKIAKDELRVAVMVQSRMHDGKDAHWFHYECFFQKNRVASVGDIANFESLRWDDQQKIISRTSGQGKISREYRSCFGSFYEEVKRDLTNCFGDGASGTNVAANGSSAKATKGKSKAAYKDYGVETAKSSRSSCVACETKIDKDELRISKLDYTSESVLSLGRGPLPRYHHVKCFVLVKDDLGFTGSPNDLPGFKLLTKEDQADLTSKFKSSGKRRLSAEHGNEIPSKVPKTDNASSASHTTTKEQQKMKKQNEKLYQIRDILQAKMKEKIIKKRDLADFLTLNEQDPDGSIDTILDRVSDMMTFGALARCVVCNGQLDYRSGVGYQCSGNISEFTKCLNIIGNPDREIINLSDIVKEAIPSYNFKQVNNRVIPQHAAMNKTPTGGQFVKINLTPLKGFKIVVSNSLPTAMLTKLTELIKSFKGAVVKQIGPKVTVMVTTKSEMKHGSKTIDLARKNNIPVVTIDFISTMSPLQDVLELMKKCLISEWTVADSLPEHLKKFNKGTEKDKVEERTTKRIQETKTETLRLQMKQGCVVDPDSELADETHVYKDVNSKRTYSVVLKKTDIDTNQNSFYKMQLLQKDNYKDYYVFRSWGRIGTTVGGKMVKGPFDVHEALDMFNTQFQEKTGNSFGSEFKMKPGLYMLMDVSYDKPAESTMEVSSQSKLAVSVQELVCLIFDVKQMMETLVEFNLDTAKMPLGKISRQQLLKGFEILSDLMKVLVDKEEESRMIIDYTNKFFSLIPHNVGMGSIPILKNKKMVQEKVEMLEQLMDIELAFEMVQEGDGKSGSSVDHHYDKLNTMIDPLEKNSTDFEFIEKYLKNTHASTHSEYKLRIKSVYKVNRNGESERFEPFKKMKNRQLLWHGSRTTNFAGILSQGLRIAPPEAPVTGYMFGKGIYFADMVSKSANYCCTNSEKTTGLLLLCEVALGDMRKLKKSNDTLLKAPKGYNSVLGLGQTLPDPKTFLMIGDHVKVPYGTPVSSGISSDLLYNEYIVYDISQVQIRYIVKVDFQYGSRY